jgi:hypothetical protein
MEGETGHTKERSAGRPARLSLFAGVFSVAVTDAVAPDSWPGQGRAAMVKGSSQF